MSPTGGSPPGNEIKIWKIIQEKGYGKILKYILQQTSKEIKEIKKDLKKLEEFKEETIDLKEASKDFKKFRSFMKRYIFILNEIDKKLSDLENRAMAYLDLRGRQWKKVPELFKALAAIPLLTFGVAEAIAKMEKKSDNNKIEIKFREIAQKIGLGNNQIKDMLNELNRFNIGNMNFGEGNIEIEGGIPIIRIKINNNEAWNDFKGNIKCLEYFFGIKTGEKKKNGETIGYISLGYLDSKIRKYIVVLKGILENYKTQKPELSDYVKNAFKLVGARDDEISKIAELDLKGIFDKFKKKFDEKIKNISKNLKNILSLEKMEESAEKEIIDDAIDVFALMILYLYYDGIMDLYGTTVILNAFSDILEMLVSLKKTEPIGEKYKRVLNELARYLTERLKLESYFKLKEKLLSQNESNLKIFDILTINNYRDVIRSLQTNITNLLEELSEEKEGPGGPGAT